MIKKLYYIIIFVSTISLEAASQKFEKLALTPPMGWNSWNTFETNINEDLVKAMADAMVSTGMRDAGYIYLVLDDGWMARERDSAGNLVPDPKKFPNGMRVVADYVHSKGLKFGLYNCAGTKTCAGYPGTRGYEYQDARFYASLEIDFLKYDWCSTQGINAKEAYTTMSKAIRTAGRPVVFSLCEWGDNKPWEWGAPLGQLWRISGDIYPCFDCEHSHGSWSSWGVLRILDMRKNIRQFAGPDHWNDLDMMEVGNGMSMAEDRAHFSIWSMLTTPLIAGNDLRKMSKETLSILSNKEVIAINQDSLGIQALKYGMTDSVDTWLKPLKNNDWAICFLNRSKVSKPIEFNWQQHTIADSVSKRTLDAKNVTYKIRDLWSKKEIGNTKKILKTIIPSHDVLMLRLTSN